MADEDEDFRPFKERLRDGLAALVAEDPGREFPPDEQVAFFESIAEDRGPVETGLSMGWSMAQIDRFCKAPERAAILDMLQEAEYESVERAIIQNARAGNSTAMKLYAFCKMPHRGWVDRKVIDFNGQSRQEIVVSVREANTATINAALEAGGVAGLQAGFIEVDMPETDDDIIDAEVVE